MLESREELLQEGALVQFSRAARCQMRDPIRNSMGPYPLQKEAPQISEWKTNSSQGLGFGVWAFFGGKATCFPAPAFLKNHDFARDSLDSLRFAWRL